VSAAPTLRRSPAFVRWATAEGISATGSAVSAVVLPILVFQRTDSPAQTALIAGLRAAPYLLFGLVAGPVADRFDRRRLIVGGNLAEGALMATIPIASAAGVLTIAQIYVVALLAATCFVFSDAAVFGALPRLVGAPQLASANGVLTSLSSAAQVIGPAIGAALAAAIGAANAVWIDAASFAVAALLVAGIRGSFQAERPPGGHPPMRDQVRQGLHYIRHHRVIRTLITAGFGNSFAFGVITGLLVVYAVRQLGIPDDSARIGVLYSAGALGALIAGLVFGRIFRFDKAGRIAAITILISAFLLGALAFVTVFAVALVVFGLFSLSQMLTTANGITYRQMATPDALQSRVNVIGRMVAWGGQPFGAAIGGVLAQATSVRTAVGSAAVLLLGVGVVTGIVLWDSGDHA
jgi:MFS family permease